MRELEKALKELPKATAKNVVRKVLKAAAEPIAEAGRANAQVREGNLKASYGVGTKLTRRQRKTSKKESPVEVYAGPNDPAAIQTEFGNEHQAAEPHLRPAWDANKAKALQLISDGLALEIQKSTDRLARKAAREARRIARGR
nr:HK97-gp10 family putative phage morphogenesis protein [Rhizobium halophytocola]